MDEAVLPYCQETPHKWDDVAMTCPKGHGGRKRKPTAELQALGSRWANSRPDEPAVIQEWAECPDWLPEKGRQYWERRYVQLYNVGIVSAYDTEAFAMLCQKFADWFDAREMCRVEGCYTKRGLAPWARHEKELYDQFYKSAREFGITPASRSTVKALAKEEPPLEAERVT